MKNAQKTLHRQTAAFGAKVLECMPEIPADIMQAWMGNPEGLKHRLNETLWLKEVKFISAVQNPLEFVVMVDRSEYPIEKYPMNWVSNGWMKGGLDFFHPDLDRVGPDIYDLRKIQLWLHPTQGSKDMTATMKPFDIHQGLVSSGLVKRCLNVQDGMAIKEKGPDVFRKIFGGSNKWVFLWKSAIRLKNKGVYVPCMLVENNEVRVCWFDSTGDFGMGEHSPAAYL